MNLNLDLNDRSISDGKSKLKLTENKIADIYEAALSEVNLQIEKRVEEVYLKIEI